MRSKRSQNSIILRHLCRWGNITSRQAAFDYGILRLSARIYDLRDAGHKIVSETVFPDRRNKRLHIAKYSIVL